MKLKLVQFNKMQCNVNQQLMSTKNKCQQTQMSTKNTQLNPTKPNVTKPNVTQPNSNQPNGCHIEVTQPCYIANLGRLVKQN